MIAAHAVVKSNRAAEFLIWIPSACCDPPKYSPTMAPIIASTVATFKAENTKGNAVGARTFRKIVSSPAAYERISSIDDGRTLVRPRSAFTITGKKHSTAATAIFELGESGSNQALKIGAKAMIGIAFAAIAIGMSARPSDWKRPTTTAKAIPADEPITNPQNASLNVYQPALQSESRCSKNVRTISDGRGSRNCWMSNSAIIPSQRTIPRTKTTSAGTQSASLRPTRPPSDRSGAATTIVTLQPPRP